MTCHAGCLRNIRFVACKHGRIHNLCKAGQSLNDGLNLMGELLAAHVLRVPCVQLEGIEGLSIYGPRPERGRTALCSFNVEGVHPTDISTLLDMNGEPKSPAHSNPMLSLSSCNKKSEAPLCPVLVSGLLQSRQDRRLVSDIRMIALDFSLEVLNSNPPRICYLIDLML